MILGGTNNVLDTLVKKNLCTLWSLTLAKKPWNNINNSRVQVPDYVISCDYAAIDKSAWLVTDFQDEIICRRECLWIQINDQGREFVNEVSDHLHQITGVDQRITSANHPQFNKLSERQNRTIINFLIKVLEEKVDQWS